MADSTLIYSGLVVTMDEKRRVITDGAVVIEDDKIVDIGKTEKLRSTRADKKIDATGMVITPGLVDCHVHVTTEQLVRGLIPDDVALKPTILEWAVPLHAAVTPEEEYLCSIFSCVELLKTGTTCFSEAGTTLNVEMVVRAMEKVGIRGTVGKYAWDVSREGSADYAMTTQEALKGIEETIRTYHGKINGKVRGSACVIGQNTCSDELFIGAKALADRYGVHMQFHQSSMPEEIDSFVEQKGIRPMHHFAKIGLLGPNLMMTHMGYLTEAEVDLIRDHDSKIVYCPSSAFKGGYGTLKNGLLPEALEKGVCVVLGCDAGGTLDMLRQMYVMAGAWKDVRANPAAVSAEKVLEMATIDGARALGLDDQIGSLEVGKKADVVLFDRRCVEWVPLVNVAFNLVYTASGNSVDTVIIDGRVVTQGKKVVGIDEESLFREVQETGEKIIDRSGLKLRRRWPYS